MFLVLVGVVATPVVVFVLDGNGELPFFGKKNETTVAELSLASITQTATPKASGAAASPMDGPQERIVALTTPPRPKSSHVTPAGSAAGSRYHAAPHHKSDSNRERVYAPTVGGTASRTTIGATAEVQALSEQVIVVPKGGVMSKLRAAGAADSAAAKALRKARLPKSSHSEVNISEQRDDNNATSTMTTGNHTAKPVGAKDNDAAAVTNEHAIASAAANDSGTTKVLPAHNASTSVTKTTAQPDSGVGVDYYDDNKNETSPSGSAEADDSHGEPKTRNRRISGEISVPTKSSKKPDVFQTEYYYDDSPSRKTEESTTQDITEPGYESVPEQEAIDELFS
ncbi:hypothetical protein HPB52_006836 [Rhipicephalus sanguineus]|uniref:Uncharacterized protein n=1 Tax=Rhipicephalus sanguineus TaxID=34632 RepID=A0A9D4PW14_RHISA|nr:hypothetical protein HPB52_006836 [Rhipicephalus sanguineus]